jgi:hypothetical protein
MMDLDHCPHCVHAAVDDDAYAGIIALPFHLLICFIIAAVIVIAIAVALASFLL